MQTLVLKENALTEDVIHIADKGKVFKGNLVAIIEYFTYANEWGDHKHLKGFKSVQTAQDYVDKNYKKSEIDVFQD